MKYRLYSTLMDSEPMGTIEIKDKEIIERLKDDEPIQIRPFKRGDKLFNSLSFYVAPKK